MTDQPEQTSQISKPAAPTRKTGLSPKEQKMQAALAKAASAKTGGKLASSNSAGSFKAKSTFAGKKTAFQRKAT